ncbi:MAG: O-antigen ligase family protein [Betaproteobacteria bacterium]|nr:O-antigen ligase family protein [Betaproteobacteria bacterium]
MSRRRFTSRQFPFETALFWCWIALLIWAPIPLGSNRPWFWGPLEAGVFVLMALWLVLYVLGRVQISDAVRSAKWFIMALAAWLVWQALFIVPVPAEWVAVLSPMAHRMQTAAQTITGRAGSMTLSVDMATSQASFLLGLTYVLAFILTLLLVNSRERVKAFGFALVFWAFLLSIYAILAHLTGFHHIWFGYDLPHAPHALATYPNRNHFAGLLEMSLAIGIGLLIAGLRDVTIKNWKDFVKRTMEWILSPKMRLRLMLCVMVIALVSTRSRMGNTAFFASLAIAGIIGIALSRHATRATVILLVSLIAIDVFIVGSWFGVEKLANRIEQTTMLKTEGKAEESVEQRQEAAMYGLDLIKDYPVFGSGPGTWYVAYPKYRGPDIVKFFDYAHNDFVQFAAESGLVGLGILGGLVVWTFVVAAVAQYQRRDPLMRGMAFASIMGILALMIHSSVDFNLQIPANALLFMVILALGWIARHCERRSTGV